MDGDARIRTHTVSSKALNLDQYFLNLKAAN